MKIEAHLSGGDGPGQVKIEIKQVKVEGEEGELLEELADAKEGRWKETVREPFKPLMDPQVDPISKDPAQNRFTPFWIRITARF